MPRYLVRDPLTDLKYIFEGETPPTDADIDEYLREAYPYRYAERVPPTRAAMLGAALRQAGIDILGAFRDVPAQIQDLLTIPGRIVGIPAPPFVSRLARETVPYVAQRILQTALTPITTIRLPQTIHPRDILTPETYIEHEITPLHLAFGAYLGAAGIQNIRAIQAYNEALRQFLGVPIAEAHPLLTRMAFRPYVPPPHIRAPYYTPEEIARAQRPPVWYVEQPRWGMGALAARLRPAAVGVTPPGYAPPPPGPIVPPPPVQVPIERAIVPAIPRVMPLPAPPPPVPPPAVPPPAILPPVPPTIRPPLLVTSHDPETGRIMHQPVITPQTADGLVMAQSGIADAPPPVETVVKVVSKYPQHIVDQKSLAEVGNAIAREMGIMEPITWVYREFPRMLRPYTASTHRYPTFKIRLSVRKGPPERMIGRAPTQGEIKSVIVHELVHLLPEIRALRRPDVMHPPGFYDRVAEERILRLFDVKEIPKQVQPVMTQAWDATFVNLKGDVERSMQAGSTVLSNLLKGHQYIDLTPTKLPPVPPPPPKALPSPPILLLPRGTVSSFFRMHELPPMPPAPTRRWKRPHRLLTELRTFTGASREYLARLAGEPGEILIHEMKHATIRPLLFAGDWNNEYNLIAIRGRGFAQEEIDNLQDVLEGRAEPMNAKVEEMFIAMDRHRKTLASLRASQDPSFRPVEHYFHHDIPPIRELRDPRVRNPIVRDMVRRGEAATTHDAELMIDEWITGVEEGSVMPRIYEHLIRKGYAKDEVDAAYLLNNFIKRYKGFEYGPFEPRTVDLPFYRPNPLTVVPAYNEGALRHLYNAERFGENAEFLWHLFDRIKERGVGVEAARTIINLFTGHMDLSDTRYLTRLMLDAQVVQRMTFSPIGNFFQGLTGSALRTGTLNAIKATADVKRNLFRAQEWAARIGQHPEFKALFVEGAGGIARRFLRIIGFTKTEVNNYINGAMTGKIYALDQFKRLQQRPGDRIARENLRRLGINPDIAIERGYLSDLELRAAGATIWREGQAIPTIWNQPQRWLGIPLTTDIGRLAWQFKSVAFPQTQLMWNSVVGRAKREDWGGFISALATLFLLYPVVGEIIESVQDTLTGRDRPKGLFPRYLDNLQGAFAFGILDDLFYLSRSGLAYALGPAMQQAGEILQGLHQLLKGKKATGLRRQIRGVPFIGPIWYEEIKRKPKFRKERRRRPRG